MNDLRLSCQFERTKKNKVQNGLDDLSLVQLHSLRHSLLKDCVSGHTLDPKFAHPFTMTTLQWQSIDTVLLDMDGTLLDLHYDNYFWLTHLPQRYAEYHGIDFDAARETLDQMVNGSEGTLQWYCIDFWSQQLRMDITTLKAEIKHLIQMRPHTEAFLKFLRHSQKKVILATNAHRKSLDLKVAMTRIDRWMDLVVSSHDFQQPKEEQGFWQQLMALEQFNLERTLFVDDNVRVLRAARDFGIAHLVCVTQPDSRRPPVASGEFIDIIDFNDILPAEAQHR